MDELRRLDDLTAQKVEVAIIFKEMMGAEDAANYMAENDIPAHVVDRVLASSRTRLSDVAFAREEPVVPPIMRAQERSPAIMEATQRLMSAAPVAGTLWPYGGAVAESAGGRRVDDFLHGLFQGHQGALASLWPAHLWGN